MSKKEDFVKFDKVDKSYDGKVLVVKDLNLDIKEGEFVTMLGPSGSGKTTCLMMLAGFERPFQYLFCVEEYLKLDYYLNRFLH